LCHIPARQFSDAAGLTPREAQCLTWAANGKTYEEIGEILKISARIVKAHIENAKRKLGVATLRDAIRVFVASGQIQSAAPN